MKTIRSLSNAQKMIREEEDLFPPLNNDGNKARKRHSGPASTTGFDSDETMSRFPSRFMKRTHSIQVIPEKGGFQRSIGAKQRSFGSMGDVYWLQATRRRSDVIDRRRRVSYVRLENARLLRKHITQVSTNSTEDEDISQQIEDLLDSSDSSVRLEEHIKLHHLQKLLHIFKAHQPPNRVIAATKKGQQENEEGNAVKQGAGMMTLQEFRDTISGMLGTTRYNDKMEMLFHKVDTACDGYVDWNEFCTYMLLQMREIEHIQNMTLIPFTSAAIIKQIFHNKQETTTKTILVENPSRLLTISKVGAIGVWDLNLRLLKTYTLAADVAEEQQQTARRRFHTWVTDAVYMRNTQNVAMTTSSREIYFYDISTPVYTIEFCLYAIPDVPVCAHYWHDKKARNGHSMLFYGDDTGAAHVLHFYSPQSRLFQKPFTPKQGMQRIYFNELKDHRKYVSYEHLGNIHDQGMKRIVYVPQGDVIISSSLSSTTSVVLMDMKQKNKPYIFKVNKGVECFDYNKALNILVTGSLDHYVRIWNPYVVARPVIILQGHSTGVCDVVINEAYAQIVTYSKDAVIKVWDIKEHTCLQTISPKFPSLQPGRIPEHGEFPLSLCSSPHDLVMVTCNDSVAVLKMGKLEPKAELPTTHDAALCSAIYNPLFHQIVTASDDSAISVWDLESGSKSMMFSNAHGQEEITCLAFDESCRRLFTGARDGTIKIWNFQNGNCLHELEAVEEAEVTGIRSFQDRNILAVGWSRKIALYDNSDPDMVNVPVKLSWKGGQLHKDDILTASRGPPNLLATGSYDGCILIWNEETQQLYMTLRDGKETISSDHKGPIDLLLFLPHRLRHSKKNRASLISSESGTLYWWCLFGRKKLLGYFDATDTKDASILALSSSSDDCYLITGDTSGHVTVWDIEDYCITDQTDNDVTDKPPIAYHWRAHDSTIVSIDFIEHDLQVMIVTASSDKTSRLWTLEGRLIGTFGQRKKWHLQRPLTYQYPKDPWGEIVERQEPGHAYRKHNVTSQSVTNIDEEATAIMTEDVEDEMLTNNSNDLNVDQEENEILKEEKESSTTNNQPADEDASDLMNKQVQITNDDVIDDEIINFNEFKTKTVRRMTSDANMDNSPMRDFPKLSKKFAESRSMTFANFKSTQKQKNLLGDQAAKDSIRRTTTRQKRRQRVGHIDNKKTQRFANLCSPFQALIIPNTEAVFFDRELPMTKEMKDRGMHCTTEADLFKLPLSSLVEFNEVEQVKGHKRKPQAITPRRGNLLPPIMTSSSTSMLSSQPAM